MTLNSFIFAGIMVLVIIFGSSFFREWVETHQEFHHGDFFIIRNACIPMVRNAAFVRTAA